MRKVPRQFRRYIERIAWIARDGGRPALGRIAVVVIVSFLGIACITSMLAGVLLYAQHLERKQELVAIGPLELDLMTGSTAFIVYAIVLGTLGVLSAILLYAAEWQISRITVAYQHRLATRLVKIAADPDCIGWQTFLRGEPRSALSRLTGIGVKLTAFAFRNMLRGIVPVMVTLFATGALIWISPGLTALLVPLALVYCIPLYLVNRGVARQHRRYMELSPRARGEVSATLRTVVDATVPDAERRHAAAHMLDDPVHAEAGDVFWRRKLASRRVQMLNTMFFVLCLIGLFVLFGLGTRTGERTWSEFLGYIVALRFVIAGIRSVTMRFIKLSRFLPEYDRYIGFVEHANALRAARARGRRADATLPESITFRCGGERRWDAPARLVAPAEGIIWIITNLRPTHAVLQSIAVVLERKAKGKVDLLSGTTFSADQVLDERGGPIHVLNASLIDHKEPEAFVDSRRFTMLVTRDCWQPLDDALEPLADRVAGVIILDNLSIIASGELDWLAEHADDIAQALRPGDEDDDDDAELDAELDEDEDDD